MAGARSTTARCAPSRGTASTWSSASAAPWRTTPPASPRRPPHPPDRQGARVPHMVPLAWHVLPHACALGCAAAAVLLVVPRSSLWWGSPHHASPAALQAVLCAKHDGEAGPPPYVPPPPPDEARLSAAIEAARAAGIPVQKSSAAKASPSVGRPPPTPPPLTLPPLAGHAPKLPLPALPQRLAAQPSPGLAAPASLPRRWLTAVDAVVCADHPTVCVPAELPASQ